MSASPLRIVLAAALTVTTGSSLVAQTTITPLIAASSNLDTEELDDIDFVEDLLDDGLPFFDSTAVLTPSDEPLTNDEDDEPTRIVYEPVDLSGAETLELQFLLATEGGFDAGAGFSISAVGAAAPLFALDAAALNTNASVGFFTFFSSGGSDLLSSGVDLTEVVLEVLLNSGFDGDDETIFFEQLTLVTTDMMAGEAAATGEGADNGGDALQAGGLDDAASGSENAGAPAPVPEPATLLIVAGLIAAWPRQRR